MQNAMDFQSDLISIITPAYKTEEYIGETIESVQNQSYQNWEMLIANDKSPDNLKEVVLRYAKEDPRIKYLEMPQNGGPAEARNLALENASGRYIAFLDSDDLWFKDKLQKQIQFLQTNDYSFCYSPFRRMTQDGKKVTDIVKVPDSFKYNELLKNTAIATLTVMIDRKKTGDFRAPNVGYDDFAMWLIILRRGHTAHAFKEDLALYRVMETSVSSNRIRAAKWVWNIYRNVEKIGVFASTWYLFNYAYRAIKKRTLAFDLDNNFL